MQSDVAPPRAHAPAARTRTNAGVSEPRLLYVWDADYPWDVRTEKICTTLTEAGWQVHIAARNRAMKARYEVLAEGTVHRMSPWRLFGRKANELSGFPAFFNPRWILLLERSIREVRPQAVIVRDLPLAPTAVFVARRHGLPVILDMAENYPAMAQDIWFAGRQKPWDGLVRNPKFVAKVERWAVKHVDHTIVVVEESADRLRQQYGVEPDRLTVVSNTPPRARVVQRKTPAAGGVLEAVYLGIMEIPRGIGELLQAQAILRDRGVPCLVRLIGDGRDLELFRRQAEELSLDQSRVEFLGRLPYATALDHVSRAHVGVVPHRADESWNTTVPNKLFDYMAAGLPVLSSDTTPCARILRETGAGVVYRSGDPASLADALCGLMDPAHRSQLASAGRTAILERFSWENDAARLHGALATVLKDGRRNLARSAAVQATG